MMKQATLAFATAILLAGISTVSAAGLQSSTDTKNLSPTAADSLSLSRIQQKVAWADLSGQATDQSPPAGFKIIAGSTAPSSVTLKNITKKAADDVPALRRYDFAIVQGKLLIVNPSDKKVAEVIRKGSFFA
jgi:hypothetical protein